MAARRPGGTVGGSLFGRLGADRYLGIVIRAVTPKWSEAHRGAVELKGTSPVTVTRSTGQASLARIRSMRRSATLVALVRSSSWQQVSPGADPCAVTQTSW